MVVVLVVLVLLGVVTMQLVVTDVIHGFTQHLYALAWRILLFKQLLITVGRALFLFVLIAGLVVLIAVGVPVLRVLLSSSTKL
jgi:hypothetical protein